MEIRSEYLASVCKDGDDHHKQLVTWVVELKSKVWELECSNRQMDEENKKLSAENEFLTEVINENT